MFKKYSLGIILGTVCYFSSAPLVAAHAAVFLNEVQPGEWIEVYSDSGATDISGWKLDDAENGGSNPYEIPAGTAIPASGFLVFERAATNIDLDTTSDSVRLLNVSGNVADSTAYSSVPTGKTYGRSSDGGGSWTVCTTTTKGASNSGSCPVQSPTLTPTLTPTATPVPTGTPAPTATRTPTPQPSKTPTPKVSKTPTPEPTEEDLADSPAPDDAASPSPTPAPAPGGSNTLQPLAIMLAFIGGGLGLIAALLVWKKRNALKMAKAMPQDLPNNEIP